MAVVGWRGVCTCVLAVAYDETATKIGRRVRAKPLMKAFRTEAPPTHCRPFCRLAPPSLAPRARAQRGRRRIATGQVWEEVHTRSRTHENIHTSIHLQQTHKQRERQTHTHTHTSNLVRSPETQTHSSRQHAHTLTFTRPFFRSLGGSAALVAATGAVSQDTQRGKRYTVKRTPNSERERERRRWKRKTHSLGTEANFVPAGSLSCGSREGATCTHTRACFFFVSFMFLFLFRYPSAGGHYR